MTNESNVMVNDKPGILDPISWIFGFVVFAIGIVNSFWGNDPFFGVFIILLSFVYFPPVTALLRKMTGFNIPRFVKIIIGVFIMWAALGVGELFDKIELMRQSF